MQLAEQDNKSSTGYNRIHRQYRVHKWLVPLNPLLKCLKTLSKYPQVSLNLSEAGYRLLSPDQCDSDTEDILENVNSDEGILQNINIDEILYQ